MSKGKAATVAAPAETAASAPPQPAGDALVLKQIKRGFAQANARLEVIREATLTVKQGEIVALMGPSGSGKSTLLHIAGLLERPESGEIWIRGQDASKLNDARRTELAAYRVEQGAEPWIGRRRAPHREHRPAAGP